MPDYEPTDAPWYKHCLKIKTVVIENGVTNIGNYAFFLCSALTGEINNGKMSGTEQPNLNFFFA